MLDKITGAEALIRGLIAENATRVFGYPEVTYPTSMPRLAQTMQTL